MSLERLPSLEREPHSEGSRSVTVFLFCSQIQCLLCLTFL